MEEILELHVRLRLDAGAHEDDAGVDGVIVDADGGSIPFSGWLALLGCLDELLDAHRRRDRAGQV